MTKWVMIVTVMWVQGMEPAPDWVMPMESEAECLEALEEWPKWRRVYNDPDSIVTMKEVARCQQRADYEWGRDRGDGDGVWE